MIGLDFSNFKVTDVKPFRRGQVVLEILPTGDASPGGIQIPESVKSGAFGGIAREHDRRPCYEALVRVMGPQDPKRPFEVQIGNRVLVDHYNGTTLRQNGRTFKLVKASEILAVFV